MRKLTAKFAALTLVASAFVIGGPTSAEGQRIDQASNATISVSSSGGKVTLSRNTVAEGRISFKVSTTSVEDTSITLFRLARHVTLAQLKADLSEVFSTTEAIAASGTRHLRRDARFFGLAEVSKTTPAKVSVELTAGDYYLTDLGQGPSPTGAMFTPLRVNSHGGHDGDRGHVASDNGGGHQGHGATITMTSAKKFDSPKMLPASGTVRVRNEGKTIHFMTMAPVAKGTTDRQIQEFFDSKFTKKDPFLTRPSNGLDVLSPGNRAELTYKIPAGRYVLMCFIPDEKTGIAHALTGMHKVVTLK